MTILEAMENALTMLEANGYIGGDVHDDLKLAAMYLRTRYPRAAGHELEDPAEQR